MFGAGGGGNKSGGFSFNTASTGGSGAAGDNSTKPSGFGGFGSGASSGNIFGSQNNSTSSEGAKPAGFSFGTSGGQSTTSNIFGGGNANAGKADASKPTFGLSSTTNTGGGFGSTGAPKFGGFGASKPAESTASTGSGFGSFKAPSGQGFSGFGTPTSAPTTFAFPSAPSASGTGGFGLGTSAAEKKSDTPTASTGGFSLNTLTTSTKAPTFGGFGASASASEKKADTPAATTGGFGLGASTTSASVPSFGSFGTSASTAEKKGDSAAPSLTGGTGIGGFKLTSAPTVNADTASADKGKEADKAPGAGASSFSLSTTAAPASGAGAKAADKEESSTDLANAALRGKTLEEIAQMWATELTTQTRAFHTQANTVKYWDRALVQQGKRITELYEATMGVESEQAALDQSLEHMEGQQTALENLLNTYEGRVQDIVRKTTARPAGKGVMTADQERDHVYSSAERLNQQLDELSRRLTTLVEDVNGISNASAPATSKDSGDGQQERGGAAAVDPFAQIVQILNAHLTSLEWIDTQTAQLQERVSTAQRMHQDVVSAQASISGTYAAPEPAERESVQRDTPLTIPGAFVSEPLPPVSSSFGTPRGSTVRKPQNPSLLGRSAAGAGSSTPFASTPLYRGTL
ncbi:FG-nucleoporin nsp1 [Coemansia guatemalensis]|uniref:FG-nucleoporin nsp1 n=1 Tax=Coemansia guatemalensis TaxID=2761395 RepID=A0A9W8HRL9_9FUNG|nr:FG-nucleoporin nsp1 [Coemansia guatemalensis]